MLFRSAVNLIHHVAPVDLTAAQRVFSELVALAAAHPNEHALRLQQAKAAVSLIHHLGSVDLAAAQSAFSELVSLAATYPEDAALEEPLMLAVALIIRASVKRDPQFAQQIDEKYGQRFADWVAARDQHEPSNG